MQEPILALALRSEFGYFTKDALRNEFFKGLMYR
jgi:hypothetical protein